MRKKESCFFVIFILFVLLGCKNSLPFDGKKYITKLDGVGIIGLEFKDNSIINLHFINMENQISEYSYDKKNNMLRLSEFGTELIFDNLTQTFKWKYGQNEFIFYETKEINLLADVIIDFLDWNPIDSFMGIKNEDEIKIIYELRDFDSE